MIQIIIAFAVGACLLFGSWKALEYDSPLGLVLAVLGILVISMTIWTISPAGKEYFALHNLKENCFNQTAKEYCESKNLTLDKIGENSAGEPRFYCVSISDDPHIIEDSEMKEFKFTAEEIKNCTGK